MRRLAKRAGIDKQISPHSLRHAAITAALDAGCSLRDVQDFARHADPRQTRRYDRARGALDRNPPTSSRPASPAPPAPDETGRQSRLPQSRDGRDDVRVRQAPDAYMAERTLSDHHATRSEATAAVDP